MISSSDRARILIQLAGLARVDVDSIDERHSFFDIGGDSLAALEFAEVLSIAVGREVDVRDVFRARTLGDLFDSLASSSLNEHPGD